MVADKDNAAFGQSGVVIITYRGPNALDTQKIVNAIIIAYQIVLEKAYESTNKQAVSILKDAQTNIGSQLAERQKEYDEFRSKHPPVINNEAGLSTSTEKLSGLESKRAELLLRQADLSYQIGIIIQGWYSGSRPEKILTTLQVGNGVARNENPLRTQLIVLRAEAGKLADNYGNDYGPLVEIREKIKLYEQELTGIFGAEEESNDPREHLKRTLSRLMNELRFVEQSLAKLNQLINEGVNTILTENEIAYKHKQYSDAIESQLEYMGTLRDKLQDLDLLADSGGYTAESLTPPSVGFKVAPKLTQSLMVGCVLGALAGIGLAYLTEMTDKRFHSPEQIRKLLGVPVVGHLPSTAPDAKTLEAIALADGPPLDPSLLTYHISQSPKAEAFRGIRTAIYFGLKGKNHKILQITSPMKGDGKAQPLRTWPFRSRKPAAERCSSMPICVVPQSISCLASHRRSAWRM